MRAAEIAPAHYLGHLGLPSYPQPAVGPKFKRGAKFVLSPNFKQACPIFCSKKPKTSASQTETWFPPPVRFPIRTPWAPKLPLHQPRNPGVLRPPPHPTHRPPPSSITLEPIPRRRRPPQPQPQRPSTASSWSRGRAVRTRASSTTPSCASPLPLQLRHPPPHRSCSCYAVLRRLGSASPPPTYGHGNTVNNLAMGSSKHSPSRTSVSPVKTRRSAWHVGVTTPATEKGTPLPLFVQILRLCLHGIHPTEDTSWPLLLDTRCS